MKKSQRLNHVSKREVGTFSPTMLGEVDLAMLKYGSHLHVLKSSVKRRKGSPHAPLVSPDGVGRRARTRGSCVNGLPKFSWPFLQFWF
jgi:hypothetical protein